MRVMKWIGIALGVLIGITLLSGLGLYAKAGMQMPRTYAIWAYLKSLPALPTATE